MPMLVRNIGLLDPLAGFKGPTSKGRGGEEGDGRGREGRRGDGRRREGRGGEKMGRKGTERECCGVKKILKIDPA